MGCTEEENRNLHTHRHSTLSHTLIHSLGDRTSHWGTHSPSVSDTCTAHTQAHTDTHTGRDGHCTCRWLTHTRGHRGTHTFTLSYTFSHRIADPHAFTHFPSDPRDIFCCGHMIAHRDMLYGRLMGRPHMCLGHQPSGSSHAVREKFSFDECIQKLAIKRSHTKAILIFISKTKFT